MCPKLYESLDQVYMTFVGCHVQGSPPITVALIDQCLAQSWILALENLDAQHQVVSLGSNPKVAQHLPLLPLFATIWIHSLSRLDLRLSRRCYSAHVGVLFIKVTVVVLLIRRRYMALLEIFAKLLFMQISFGLFNAFNIVVFHRIRFIVVEDGAWAIVVGSLWTLCHLLVITLMKLLIALLLTLICAWGMYWCPSPFCCYWIAY